MVIKLEEDEVKKEIKKEYRRSYIVTLIIVLVYSPAAYFFLWDGSELTLFLNVSLFLCIVFLARVVYYFKRILPLNKKLWEYEWEESNIPF